MNTSTATHAPAQAAAQPLDLQAEAEVYEDTEDIAAELEARAVRLGPERGYFMREAAVHMRGLHALMLRAVERAQPEPQRDKLIDMQDVTSLIGVRPSTVYAMIKSGDFPPGVKIGPRLTRWPESLVQAWIVARCAAAENGGRA